MDATPLPAETRIGHVHLKVADLDRAIAFYRDTMGFDLLLNFGTAAFLSAGGYHHHIGLNTWESKGGEPPAQGTTGLYHFAINYPTRRDLAAALVPGLLESLPSSLYAELERRNLAPTWGEDSVDAGLAQEPECRLLGLPVGHPVLRVARRAFCDRSPIEVSRSTYRADRFTMWVPLTRLPQPRHH